MTDLERARQVFGKDRFATETTGCVVDEVGQGYAKCSLDLLPAHRNALGVPMGGAVFTLADFTFGVASNFDTDVYVSTAAHIHFLKPARGDRLIAEARPIHRGRRTCVFDVTVRDEFDTLVASVTVSGQLVRERQTNERTDG